MDSEECLAKLEKKRKIIEELKDAKECMEYRFKQKKTDFKHLLSVIARQGNKPFSWCSYCRKPNVDKRFYTCAGCFARLPCEEWCKIFYPELNDRDYGNNQPPDTKTLGRCRSCKGFLCASCGKEDRSGCNTCNTKK